MARKRKPKVITKQIAELMAAMREDNPRLHSVDGDVKKLAASLLWGGWCELPSFNEENGQLIGGHGRVMACEWLIQQTREWFEAQWEKYRAVNPDAPATNQERFIPTYWLRVPLKVSVFDENLHKAMMIRLNNAAVRGQSNEEMKALLLSKLKPEAAEVAMPDPDRRANFLTRFGLKGASRIEQEQAENEATREIAQTAMANFTPEPEQEEWDYDSPEESPGFAGAMPSSFGMTEEGNEEPETGLEVQEGGANVNADPPPGKKKQVMFPIAVILSERRYQQWLSYKESLGVVADQVAFLKGHIVFKQEPIES